jgi:hypothetical protein
MRATNISGRESGTGNGLLTWFGIWHEGGHLPNSSDVIAAEHEYLPRQQVQDCA